MNNGKRVFKIGDVEILEMIISGHFGSPETLPFKLNEWPQVRPAFSRILARLQTAEAAVRSIADPIRHMRESLKAGEQLDGAMAVRLAEDPHYLQGIARRAVQDMPDQE